VAVTAAGQKRAHDPLEGDVEAQEERYDLFEDDDGDEETDPTDDELETWWPGED
jgi:hypothetical protein